METANYNTYEIEYGGYASTNPGHHNDTYRMVEYLDTIMGVTIELRQLVQKHVSPTNQDYGLILCMFTQIYDQVSSACLEVEITN
ncbi:hypothetical protein [Trichlorobacter lovleyi]|uniref:hypothetical protein n=1 Tax=Trichlorobacter lovleyi TaxID=313985 RepID=UPI003D107FB8